MTESENLSRAFYHDLGADRLAQRTNPDSDAWTIAAITSALPHRARVLDAGCGYGRIAVPLAAHGFSVVGVDLSPEMLREARSRADRAGVKVPCVLGSMTHLPYDNNAFDAVLCLWSAFNEILEEEEQFLALESMWRVMASGALLIVEGRIYSEASEDEIRDGLRRGIGHRVDWDLVAGRVNPHYRHDGASLATLCQRVGVQQFRAETKDWAGRERLLLEARKL